MSYIHSTPQRPSAWLESFTKSIIPAVENPAFALIDNNEEKIQYILAHISENEKTKTISTLETVGKSSRVSTKFRVDGNDFFTSKQEFSLDKAVEAYTKSVAHGPPGSQELSLAYANRSAVLFEAKLFSECIEDIERAIDNNYPDNLKAKLYLRKAMCCQAMDYDELLIEDSLAAARKWLGKLDEKNKKHTETLLQRQYKGRPIDTLILRKNPYHEAPPALTKENSAIPGLSAAVELKYSKKYGRHIVATRDIKPGELLVRQKPYATVIPLKLRYKVCWSCAKQTWTGLPCDDCTDVVYCSEFCRKTDKEKQHKFECGVLGPMIASGMGDMIFMSLRLTIKALVEAEGSLDILMSDLKAIDVVQDLLGNNALDPAKYASVYIMNTNAEGKMLLKSLFLAESILIAYLLATETQFFGKKMSGDLSAFQDNVEFIFIVGLVEKNYHLSITNSFEMNILLEKDKIRLFNTIAAPISFFNHSCNPMVIKRLHDNFVTSYALYPIKKGEQIFDCYGLYYYLSSKQERQSSLLEQYHFICDCEACKNDWSIDPIDSNLEKDDEYEANIYKLRQAAEKFMSVTMSLENAKQFLRVPISTSTDVDKLGALVEKLCSRQERNSSQVFQSIRLLEGFLCATETQFHSLR